MAKHFFKWCYFWLLADAVGDLQEGWGQTSRELFPQLPPVRAALSPGFCALYSTSRQDFVWSQGWNIIPAHPAVVYWQSGWAHYREQNKRWLWNPTFPPNFRQCLYQKVTAELCWGGKQGALLWSTENFTFGADKPLIPSCLSTGAAQVLRSEFWEDPCIDFYCVKNEQNPPCIWTDQRYRGLYELW